MDDLHRKILRKFHTLCTAAGLTADEKMDIISSCGVEHSSEIDTHALIDICASLTKQIEGSKYGEMDRLRKQAMAAIGGYLRAVHKQSSAEIIKGIACRATEYEDFNKIPAERLRNLYYAFRNKQKDISSVDALAVAMAMQGLNQPVTVN